MKLCSECGNENPNEIQFCTKCGADVTAKPIPPQRVGKSSSSKRNKVLLLATALILVISLIVGYQMGTKKYSEEAVVERFITALEKKDKNTLKELIVPVDSRIKINDESLGSLLALFDKNPSLLQTIESSLRQETLTDGMFTVHQNGKKYGVIPNHAIDTTGYFLSIDASGSKTAVYVEGNEMGLIGKIGETNEFGPFLGGIYLVKGVGTAGQAKKEDTQKVMLAGTQSTIAITLATAEEKKKEIEKQVEKPKEVVEKVVIKEVIREVPSGWSEGYYIIPNSDYVYLTESDLYGLSKRDIKLAKNEIYARHGYQFKTESIQNHFDMQSWYYPDASYDGSLSAVEGHNVSLLKSYE